LLRFWLRGFVPDRSLPDIDFIFIADFIMVAIAISCLALTVKIR